MKAWTMALGAVAVFTICCAHLRPVTPEPTPTPTAPATAVDFTKEAAATPVVICSHDGDGLHCISISEFQSVRAAREKALTEEAERQGRFSL